MDSQHHVSKEAFFAAIEENLQTSPDGAVHILRDPKYKEIIKNSGWEFVPQVFAHLTDKNNPENSSIYNTCLDILMEIANIADPEDILFEFIQQAEKQTSNEIFIFTLKAIRIILLRSPQRRGTAISWCSSTIVRHLAKVFSNPNTKYEGDELLLLENETKFQQIGDIYNEALDFFSPFLKEIKSGAYSVPEKHISSYKDTVLMTLLKLLGHPLMNTHLECGKSKGLFRIIAEEILLHINNFNVDLFSFLEYINFSKDRESEIDNESLGVFFYLLLEQGIYIERVPHVYSNIYLLKQLLWACISLMKAEDINAQWKGLSLAENALNRVSDREINFTETNRLQWEEFAMQSSNIIIFSVSRRNREKAVVIFRKFLRMFDPCGRYYLVLCLQDVIKQPGFIGFLVTNTKDFIDETLFRKNKEELKYFTGKCLKDLIKKFCYLEEYAESDLMHYSELIIPTLNLLRYLIIRDTTNCTGFQDILSYLNDSYFEPLKKALEMSRAHYKLQKKEINEPLKAKNAKSDTILTLNGVNLPDLEKKNQLFDNAMNIFDLIESLLTRVIELGDNMT